MKIPYIPEDAPFSGDQRAWLSGFLAGLHSRLSLDGEGPAVATATQQRTASPLHILFGSQTGNAEGVAMDAANAARAAGMQPVVEALDDVDLARFATMKRVLVVTSTYGEGEMPDNAQLFWETLASDDAPRLEAMHFGVLALGDTGYDGFCQSGKLIDTRLEQLGATRMLARVDCDVDYENVASSWVSDAMPLAAAVNAGGSEPALAVAPETAPAREKSPWNRKTPYLSTVTVNRTLSGTGSGKEIRHYEFDLGDSGIEYEAGDALGVMPVNDPALVDAILARVGTNSEALVAGLARPLGIELSTAFEISTPSRELIAGVEKRANHEELSHVLRHGDKEALDAWLWSKDILDLLLLNPSMPVSAEEFVGWLKPLQHRAYSISSSPLEARGSVHLTIASVRYHSHGRIHGGVCSTYLADRVADGGKAGIFVSPNKAFRVPQDNDAPVIMVGPGTGIAPFRAFLQERRARGAKGRNWLFFGDQHRASDFIYEEELGAMSNNGTLTRLDLAFSRDQSEKIYVQTRMRENGKALYAWLEEGGHFYVCGDATRMAKDVDQALHELVASHGGMTPEEAGNYVNRLKREKRYLRDVY
ncbi:sulfite reductase subunit alpha [Sinorhizobium sp. BG8]|uniref:sulfite reductase subunit alpha n=1 Tax=Sinorhizobium sp. BG8 TaxID=2613773 RepID=UPI00193D8ADD|nr:sulfite reductase subunit alpha [Sinorhizobium sp. BG8]QRM57839.1 sulfite reductase subunit alpha [Sinorhizobium sp. BG8]